MAELPALKGFSGDPWEGALVGNQSAFDQVGEIHESQTAATGAGCLLRESHLMRTSAIEMRLDCLLMAERGLSLSLNNT